MICNMTELPAAYYHPLGDGHFEPTEATTSPWDAGAQHGGPPTALLASCLDDAFGRPGLRVARISMDFLGPVPRAPSRVQTELLRPGRRTQLSEASLWAGERRVAVARVWHLATGPGPEADATSPAPGNRAHPREDARQGGVPHREVPVPVRKPSTPQPGPSRSVTPGSPSTTLHCLAICPIRSRSCSSAIDQWGYGRATEWRTVSGGYASTTGAADVWTRVRIPLIAGRPLDGLARFAIVADSANGLSAPLSFREWLFIPPGVTMHLHRYPAGEWVRLTANSDPGRDGIGLTDGALSDATGRCGTVAQPLLVTLR